MSIRFPSRCPTGTSQAGAPQRSKVETPQPLALGPGDSDRAADVESGARRWSQQRASGHVEAGGDCQGAVSSVQHPQS